MQIRRALGDFGIPIAIAVMVFLDYLIQDTYTEVSHMIRCTWVVTMAPRLTPKRNLLVAVFFDLSTIAVVGAEGGLGGLLS